MGKYVADIGGVTTAAFLDVDGKNNVCYYYTLKYLIMPLYKLFIHIILDFMTV